MRKIVSFAACAALALALAGCSGGSSSKAPEGTKAIESDGVRAYVPIEWDAAEMDGGTMAGITLEDAIVATSYDGSCFAIVGNIPDGMIAADVEGSFRSAGFPNLELSNQSVNGSDCVVLEANDESSFVSLAMLDESGAPFAMVGIEGNPSANDSEAVEAAMRTVRFA